MSAWRDVDTWRDEHNPSMRRNALQQLARKEEHVWHARVVQRAWLYRTKAGEEREWLQHQLSHAHNLERVSLRALCSRLVGPIPMLDKGTSNHLTQKLGRVTCSSCKVLLDFEAETGRLEVDRSTTRFRLKDDPTPLAPRDDRGERCLICKGRIETCGHFVGAGAL